MASKVAGYIGKIEKNGDWVAIGSTAYGVCDTAANVAEKVVDMKGFELITGATVFVKFVHENTAQNPTVNVNETGAKGIISADNSPVSAWLDGAVLALTFDGNNWATSGDPSGSAIDEAISTVSGSLITLTDATDAPVADLKVAIEPVQAGSGDPSPSNVREITGWNVCNVASTGKNLLPSLVVGTYTSKGITATVDATGLITVSGTKNEDGSINIDIPLTDIAVLPVGVYLHIRNSTTDGAFDFRSNGMSPSMNAVNRIYRLTKPVNTTLIRLYYGSSPITISQTIQPSVELTNDVTVYEPYQGQTVTIDLGGTRYGGYLNVTTGELTVDRAMADLGTFTWTYVSGSQRFQSTNIKSVMEKPSDATTVFNGICSAYKSISANQSYTHSAGAGIASDTSGNLFVYDPNYSDVDTFEAAMSGVQLVYPLATPQTIQLTPAEVRTLTGECHVWADTGDITSLTYWKEAGEGISKAVSNASANAKLEDGQTRSMITQSSETSMVATKDYSEGDLVIIGGQLLRATENIATATELVIGEDGNVEVVDLETITKELSARIGALEE